MIVKYETIEQEVAALKRERELKDRAINRYNNKLINEIQNEDISTFLSLKKRKKSFIQKLLSVFK